MRRLANTCWVILGLCLAWVGSLCAQPIYTGNDPNITASDSVNFHIRLTQGFDVTIYNPKVQSTRGYRVKNGFSTYYLYVVKAEKILVNGHLLENNGNRTFLVVYSDKKRVVKDPDSIQSRALYLLGMIDTIGGTTMREESEQQQKEAAAKPRWGGLFDKKDSTGTDSAKTVKPDKPRKDKDKKSNGKEPGKEKEKDKAAADKKGQPPAKNTTPAKTDPADKGKKGKKGKKDVESAEARTYVDPEAEAKAKQEALQKKQEEQAKKKAEKSAAQKAKRDQKSSEREKRVLRQDSLKNVLADSLARAKALQDSLAQLPPPEPVKKTYEEVQYERMIAAFKRAKGSNALMSFFLGPFFYTRSLQYNLENCPHGVPFMPLEGKKRKAKPRKPKKKNKQRMKYNPNTGLRY
ncbi:MAG: hypothetical protein KF690_07495 [Bacteroidetes bacterium]|nr:hypothetical protein [Bacteroidota bacterium]